MHKSFRVLFQLPLPCVPRVQELGYTSKHGITDKRLFYLLSLLQCIPLGYANSLSLGLSHVKCNQKNLIRLVRLNSHLMCFYSSDNKTNKHNKAVNILRQVNLQSKGLLQKQQIHNRTHSVNTNGTFKNSSTRCLWIFTYQVKCKGNNT